MMTVVYWETILTTLDTFFVCTAVWMMGNLARATYVPSTEFMWPYSTNVCRSSSEATQEINACSTPQGRGAPEIDLAETMYERPWSHPVLSASLQVAPGIAKHRPIPGHKPNSVSANVTPKLFLPLFAMV
jgi:hypothetical protein